MFMMITGGSASGKSSFAEEQILSFGGKKRVYIATMMPYDRESRERVLRHRKMREGKGFETVECFTGLSGYQPEPESDILLECMSNLTCNEMFLKNGAKDNTVLEICKGIAHLLDHCRNLIVVTNEVFSDVNGYSEETVRYQEYLGRVNCRMAEKADRVIEVVYGIPVVLKG
ncbi:MAG: bifunctional adenosylcobinamide kinase/adenosylcobinamide-phosphate guanylyltransferase [Blautia sp.]|nr:bifunctional adenosylcobinamide kinase/adenosylcobinamide-phosphate guanylyltransferase [Blautia sp.]